MSTESRTAVWIVVLLTALIAAFLAGTWYGSQDRECVSGQHPAVGLVVSCGAGPYPVSYTR